MNKINQICIVILTLSFSVIALVQTGVVKPAHAISLNAAMRLIMDDIKASEDRLTVKIEEVCAKEG